MILITPRLSDVRRAIEIAQHDDLQVVGKVDANGTHVYAVPSRSEPGKIHLPFIDPVQSRIVCDCVGYQYRGVCAHAMVVTRAIIDEAQMLIEAQQASKANLRAAAE